MVSLEYSLYFLFENLGKKWLTKLRYVIEKILIQKNHGSSVHFCGRLALPNMAAPLTSQQ